MSMRMYAVSSNAYRNACAAPNCHGVLIGFPFNSRTFFSVSPNLMPLIEPAKGGSNLIISTTPALLKFTRIPLVLRNKVVLPALGLANPGTADMFSMGSGSIFVFREFLTFCASSPNLNEYPPQELIAQVLATITLQLQQPR